MPALPATVGSLPPSATAMVLLAAVAHATWNAIAHGIADKVVALSLFAAGGAALAVPLIVVAPLPDTDSWPWLVVSVLLHIGYQLLLMRSYQLGEFSQMYPLARGSSPLLVTVFAAVFVGELPVPLELIGVTVVSAGLAGLVLAGRRLRRADRPAVLAALGTGLTIALYTTADGSGVRASGTAAGYTGWLIMLNSLVTVTFVLSWRGPGIIRQLRPHAMPGLLCGMLSVLAYGLVLWAQTRGPLAPIAALRETSIVLAAVIGSVVFREGFGARRLVATAVVLVGVVLINAG